MSTVSLLHHSASHTALHHSGSHTSLHHSSSHTALPEVASGCIVRSCSSPALATQNRVRLPKSKRKSILSAVPSSAEELLQPLAERHLPEWAQGYVSLLAESSSSPGSMKKHLVKLLARGASDTAKVAQFVANPVKGLTGAIADTGSEMLRRQLALDAEARALSGWSQQDWAHMRPALVPVRSGASPSMPYGMDGRCGADGAACSNGWSGMAASEGFRGEGSGSGSGISPLHEKVLSFMLSLIMSGAASGVADALQGPLSQLQQLPAAAAEEIGAMISEHMAAGASAEAAGMAAAAATPAPQLAEAFSAAGAGPPLPLSPTSPAMARTLSPASPSAFMPTGAGAAAGTASSPSPSMSGAAGMGVLSTAGGMATSIAMKLLRADSKGGMMPGLDDMLGAFLATVNESIDEMDKSAGAKTTSASAADGSGDDHAVCDGAEAAGAERGGSATV